jgi:hypothetical protein
VLSFQIYLAFTIDLKKDIKKALGDCGTKAQETEKDKTIALCFSYTALLLTVFSINTAVLR